MFFLPCKKKICEGTFYQEWARKPTTARGKAQKSPDNAVDQKFAINKKSEKLS